MPSLFVSHGSPMVALDGSPAHHFFTQAGSLLPRPRAIIVVSAHHQGRPIEVTASAHPPTIYDFGPFDHRLFKLSYPAPGEPALAQRCVELLLDAGLPARLSMSRGFDHGAWIPLMLMYPAADIPVVQVSLPVDADPTVSWRLGQALAPLAVEPDVLVIGSGAVTHDLRRVFGQPMDAPVPVDTERFATWIGERVVGGEVDTALNYRALNPDGVRNHPTEEHLMPLFVAWGAAGRPEGQIAHQSAAYGGLRMDAYFWV